MLLPFLCPILYVIGSWAVQITSSVSGWLNSGYRYRGLFNSLGQNTLRWWEKNGEIVLMHSLVIALSAGILSLVLHLFLPRSDRHHE
jgi:hypothetical protein